MSLSSQVIFAVEDASRLRLFELSELLGYALHVRQKVASMPFFAWFLPLPLDRNLNPERRGLLHQLVKMGNITSWMWPPRRRR